MSRFTRRRLTTRRGTQGSALSTLEIQGVVMQNYTTSELEQHAADVKAALADERDPEERRLLREELAETERQLKDQRERHATLLALADRPENIDRPSPSLTVRGDRDRSLRAIERHIDVLTPEA